MISRTLAIARLYEWRNRHYFCAEAWERRGLIRSPDPIPSELGAAKNALLDDLLKAVLSGGDETRLTAMVMDHWKKEVGGRRFDTEEREFLGDCFFEITAVLELSDFKERLKEAERDGLH